MRRPSASLLVTFTVVLFTAVLSVRGLWWGEDGKAWQTIIRSDAKGYYGYLMAICLRHDLGHEEFVWEYVNRTPTGTLNKYFCGTSVMMAPWFALGHFALADPDKPRDGFTIYELTAISMGAWAYLLLGMLALRALFRGMGIRDGVIACVLLGLGLGTTLLQYAALQPGWSHVYSFCAVSVFLLLVHRLVRGASLWWAVAAAAVLGLVVLIRPVNALVLLAVPVVAGADTLKLAARLFKRPLVLGSAILAGALVVGIQPLLWHFQTGHWFEWGYKGEGFHWGRSEMVKVLFGFRRGLFLWTPFFLLAAMSAVLLWGRDRVRSVSSLVYWGVNTFVISSWWIWYYGSGFGSRVFIDHYPVLVLPLALVLHHWQGRWWIAARVFIVACITLQLAQMWQYHARILHHESMDREKYFYSFLKFGDAYRNQLGGNYQAAPFNPNGMDVVLEESCDMEHRCTYWSEGKVEHRPEAFSKDNVCIFEPSIEFGLSFKANTDVIPTGRALFLEVGLQRYEVNSGDSHSLYGVTEVKRPDGTPAYYEPFPINPVPGKAGVWQQLEYRIPVPPLEPGDELRFYFWNHEHTASLLIDDVFMRVSAVRPY
ncbi:MAG: hypothetical protein ABI432_01050 [Flavobacteriales bacterium]